MNEEIILSSVVPTAYSREEIEPLRWVFDVIHFMSESINKNVLQAWQLVCTTMGIHHTPSTRTYPTSDEQLKMPSYYQQQLTTAGEFIRQLQKNDLMNAL